eukprot:SAG31_NODE_16_length_36206_cov_27.355728_24_plen_45_part_00
MPSMATEFRTGLAWLPAAVRLIEILTHATAANRVEKRNKITKFI